MSEAQSGLVFDRPAWDFGTIRETDGPVTHRFVCRNEGEHPEVILQVTDDLRLLHHTPIYA